MVDALSPKDFDLTLAVSALVVDDDPVSNRLVQARLSALGHDVVSAPSGEEALERLANLRPDLILLDVSMPGIGGLEVLAKIRARRLNLAVIMMTAYGTEEVAIEALRQGADDYLRKPFKPAEFQTVLNRTISRLLLGRQNEALRHQLDEKRRQLEAELTRAAEVQADLLPSGAPKLTGFDLAAACVPARQIGGDFYGWTDAEENCLTLTLGDVMGKGMPAALLMATVRAVLRALSPEHAPEETMNMAARALEADLQRSGRFVTLFHARLDASARRLSYVDAGHGHAFIRRADGGLKTLEEGGGLPLGILPGASYRDGHLALDPGDTLVVYSDGLVDANPGAVLDNFSIAEALNGASGAAEMVDRLIRLPDLVGPPPDDLTVLVLHCRQEI